MGGGIGTVLVEEGIQEISLGNNSDVRDRNENTDTDDEIDLVVKAKNF